MAMKVEWRRRPDRQHTGSAELRGVPGSPFIYVHPHDKADAPRGSCAGSWFYDHRDTTESPVVASKSGIYVDGSFSYADYASIRGLYQKLWRAKKIALFIGGNTYHGQDSASKVLGAPLATSIQVSGQCVFEAYLVFDPPPSEDRYYDIRAECEAYARGRAGKTARIGMGRAIKSHAAAFDHNGQETVSAKASAKIVFPRQRRRVVKSQLYRLHVRRGTREILIGRTSTGPAYSIAAAWSSFVGWGRIAYTIWDQENHIVLQPKSETDD